VVRMKLPGSASPAEGDEYLFVLSDPRLSDKERNDLYEIGVKIFGKPAWNLKDIVVGKIEAPDEFIQKVINQNPRLREMWVDVCKASEGFRRAATLTEAMGDSRLSHYEVDQLISNNPIDSYTLLEIVRCVIGKDRSAKASLAANIRNAGNRIKRQAIQLLWASGKYSNRDLCAEQECAALEMSFSSARKALRGTPDPQLRGAPKVTPLHGNAA